MSGSTCKKAVICIYLYQQQYPFLPIDDSKLFLHYYFFMNFPPMHKKGKLAHAAWRLYTSTVKVRSSKT